MKRTSNRRNVATESGEAEKPARTTTDEWALEL